MSIPVDAAFPSSDENTQLMGDLADRYSSRYEAQASKLLTNGELIVSNNASTLKYRLEGIGCSVNLSVDSGLSFRKLGECRLDGDFQKKKKTLFWEFAGSEARVMLEEGINPSTNG